MKKPQAERTNADNLETRFDGGKEVLDYFDVEKAQTALPKKSGLLSSIIENPQAITTVHEKAGRYGASSNPRTQTSSSTKRHAVPGSSATRTVMKNAKTGGYAKRKETKGSPQKGEFMDVKSDGKPFKGVANEPDKRRK